MVFKSNHLQPVMTVILLLLVRGADSKHVHVSVMNRLRSGNMTLHCQSKDTDLGQQTVPYGSEFGWDFNVNIWGTTLFFCNLGWQKVAEFSFVSYEFHRDFVRCGGGQCLWIIASEGVYGLNDQTGMWEYAYSWPN